MDGSKYRLRATHPRRPHQPLDAVYRKNGSLLVKAGQTCAGVSDEELRSLVRNGYVEAVAVVKRSTKKEKNDGR